MAIEIKKLSQVDVAEEITEDAKVLVEDGGTIKRVSKAQVGRGGLPDSSELPNGTALVAVNGEWKMQDGYGYTVEPTVITFDGDLTGKTVVDVGSGAKLVHVSDLVPSLSDLQGSTGIYYHSDPDFGDMELSLTCSEEPDGMIIGGGELYGAFMSNMFFVIPESFNKEDVTFPKSGIYVMYVHSTSASVEQYLKQLTFGGASVPISSDLIPATSANKVTLVNAEEYFDSDTVEGALAEIGAELDGLSDALSAINDGLEAIV